MALSRSGNKGNFRGRFPQKKEAEHRINNLIRVPKVRLVGENVEVGIYSIQDALRIANELELDLVEISPKVDPPVCKVIDYNKFLYDKKKKEKEMKAKAKASEVKDVIKLRENPLIKIIYVETEDVTIKLYDNGEIDGDSISVFLDNKVVLHKKLLTASPLTIKIKMDEDNVERELVMVAENLGRMPPNTSLMIVNAGDKRYEVRISSTEQKNAVVRFIYKKPK